MKENFTNQDNGIVSHCRDIKVQLQDLFLSSATARMRVVMSGWSQVASKLTEYNIKQYDLT